jgi:sigma-B regulation protein RsbU (phosphoserine phosphatase)
MISVSRRGLEPGEYKITRSIRMINGNFPPTMAAPNPWRDWDSIPVRRGGFIGRVIESDAPQVYRDLAIDLDPVLADAVADMRFCVAIPNYDNGEALNWGLWFTRDPEGWTSEQVEFGLLTGNLLGMATSNLVAHKRAADLNRRLEKQLVQIANIQRSLLPQRLPDIPGLKIAASYLTSDESGGDYYDFFPFADGRWGIVIADVSGHGAAAATVMAMLHAILHGYESGDVSPAAILKYANRRLVHTLREGSFVTAFLGVYDPRERTLTFARAGHNPPRLKHGASGNVTDLAGEGDPPLGLFEDFEPSEELVQLQLHDTIVLYTDGITEAMNASREMFGVAGLDAALDHCTGDPDCVMDSVHAALYQHTNSRGRDDDQTLVAIRFVGPGVHQSMRRARRSPPPRAGNVPGGAPRAWRRGRSKINRCSMSHRSAMEPGPRRATTRRWDRVALRPGASGTHRARHAAPAGTPDPDWGFVP